MTPEQLMAQATVMANQGGPGKNAPQAQAWLENQMKAQGFQTRQPQDDLLAQFDGTNAKPSAAQPTQAPASGLLADFDSTPSNVSKNGAPLPNASDAVHGESLIQKGMDVLGSALPGMSAMYGPQGSQLIEHALYKSGIPGAQTVAGALKGETDIPNSIANIGAKVASHFGIAPEADKSIQAATQKGNADYEALRSDAAQGKPGFDWGRLGGQVLATSPLSAVKLFPGAGGLADVGAGAAAKRTAGSLAKTFANNAAQGGAAAGLTSNQSDASLGSQLSGGAILGAVLPPVANAVLKRTLVPAVDTAMTYGRKLVGGGASDASQIADDVMHAAVNGATPKEQASAARTVLDQHAPELNDALTSNPKGVDGIDMSKVPLRVKQLLSQSYLKDLTPEQQKRVLTYEALGIKNYTLADVTRNYADATATRNLAQNAELGAPIREADLAKNQQLLQAADKAKSMTGGQADNSYSTGKQIQNAFTGQLNSINGKINSLYQQADQAAKGTPQVVTKPISNTLSGLRSEFLASSDGKGLLNGIRARLQDFSGGPPANPGKVLLVDANGKPLLTEGDIPQKMTFQDSEKFRQYLNDVWSPDNSRLVSKIKSAVDNAQDQAGGGEIYKEARFLRHNRAQMFENQDGVARIASGKVPVDRIVDLYVNNKGNADALSQMVNQLKTGGNADVIKNLKATVVQQMIDKATSAGGPNQAGSQNFSGLMFKRQLDNIGSKKLSVLFSPQEQNYLGSLARGAVDLTTDPIVRNNFNPSGTSSQAANALDQIYGVSSKDVQGLKKIALKAALSKIPGASVVKEVSAQAKDRAQSELNKAKVAGSVNPNEAFATKNVNANKSKISLQKQAQRDAIIRALQIRASNVGTLNTQQGQ